MCFDSCWWLWSALLYTGCLVSWPSSLRFCICWYVLILFNLCWNAPMDSVRGAAQAIIFFLDIGWAKEAPCQVVLDPVVFPDTWLCQHGCDFICAWALSLSVWDVHSWASIASCMNSQSTSNIYHQLQVRGRDATGVCIRLGTGFCQSMIIKISSWFPGRLLFLTHHGRDKATNLQRPVHKIQKYKQWHARCLFIMERLTICNQTRS